jgi:hypothetical protein
MFVQPAGDVAVEAEAIRTAWENNHNGAGFMYVRDGRLIVRKPFYKLKDLLAAYEIDHGLYGKDSPFALHLRMKTHGEVDETNTHPHVLIDGQAALMHNGVLSVAIPAGCGLSDTAYFCRTVLLQRQASQLTGKRLRRTLEEMIGEWNKFIIMDYTGRVSICNAAAGSWDGNRWYSGMAHIALPPMSYAPLGYWDASESHPFRMDDEQSRNILIEMLEDSFMQAEMEHRDTDKVAIWDKLVKLYTE